MPKSNKTKDHKRPRARHRRAPKRAAVVADPRPLNRRVWPSLVAPILDHLLIASSLTLIIRRILLIRLRLDNSITINISTPKTPQLGSRCSVWGYKLKHVKKQYTLSHKQ